MGGLQLFKVTVSSLNLPFKSNFIIFKVSPVSKARFSGLKPGKLWKKINRITVIIKLITVKRLYKRTGDNKVEGHKQDEIKIVQEIKPMSSLSFEFLLTILVGLIKRTITSSVYLSKKLFIEYPDVSMVLVSVLAVIFTYYFVKNAVKIIYGLVIATIKIVLFLSVLLIGLWIYYRGITQFISDLSSLTEYLSQVDEKTVIEAQDYLGQLRRKANVLITAAQN